MAKIALAMIVKGASAEAPWLARCLKSVAPHVDGLFITITQPNKKVEDTAKLFSATVSHFEWVSHFGKARTFNFEQVPPEYTHILWLDADDVLEGGEKLKDLCESHPNVDGFSFFYHYDHDEYGLPTTVHQKIQLVRNNGAFVWSNEAIHEDLDATRQVNIQLVTAIKRIHHHSKERTLESAARNLDIAKLAKHDNPTDPRRDWNLAQATFGVARYDQAIKIYKSFLKRTQSSEESYLAYLRMGDSALCLNDDAAAEDYYRQAIAVKPAYPDAFLSLANIMVRRKNWREAEELLLDCLQKKPPIYSIIVFNPRDYDYNPLMLLSKVYWEQHQPLKARICLQGCKQIQPANRNLDKMIRNCIEEQKALKFLEKVMKRVAEAQTDAQKLHIVYGVPKKFRLHPAMLFLRNQLTAKNDSAGNEVVYYCGNTDHVWNPQILKEKGVGGSEEAVIHLSRELVKLGLAVTVYNNCGEGGMWDGVVYRPWHEWNPRSKVDVCILWRNMSLLERGDINATRIYVDLHDAMGQGEFTEGRLNRLDKIFIKSDAHRALFPKVPDSKFVIVPNGIQPEDFTSQFVERDPFLICNTSSPDRSLSALIRIFPRIKAIEPRARLKWAYGWGVFDSHYRENKPLLKWKRTVVKQAEEAGIEMLGKISHPDIVRLMKGSGVFLYPTTFYEIDCISARKAQLAGAIPVTSDFAALSTTVQHGTKVPSSVNIETWAPPYKHDFGETQNDEEYVSAVINAMRNPDPVLRLQMAEWATQFSWENVAKTWYNTIT